MSSSTRGKYEVANDGRGGSEEPKGRCSFLYDSSTGTVMGRTAKSWFLITVFYIIYYSCLAGFFAGMISVFLYGIIEENRPYRTGQQSLLKLNPGMGFRPQPDVDSTLIKFTANDRKTYAKYVKNLMKLYEEYNQTIEAGALSDSCGGNGTEQDPTKVCKFDWRSELPDCRPENEFGYAGAKPCVLLKMNRVFGWLPDPINTNTPHPIVRCYGDNPADAENLGKLKFQPSVDQTSNSSGYFSQEYFPYLKQKGYQAPLVALIFSELPRNTLVMVECRLENLRNAEYSRVDKNAMVRFDIFMRK